MYLPQLNIYFYLILNLWLFKLHMVKHPVKFRYLGESVRASKQIWH